MSRRNTRKAKLNNLLAKQIQEASIPQEPISELPQKRRSNSVSQSGVTEASPSSISKKPFLKGSASKDHRKTSGSHKNSKHFPNSESGSEPVISLYLTSIPKSCTAGDLTNNLSQYGAITEVTLLKDSYGNLTGSGIVKFEAESSCMRAFCAGSFKLLGGKVLSSLLSYYDNEIAN